MIFKENIQLANLTTMRVGGPARFFSLVQTRGELARVVAFAQKNDLPIFILGGGSNIVVSDRGFNGLVIKQKFKSSTYAEGSRGKVRVNVDAGAEWDDLVRETVEKKLYGLENLSLIPGTVGAAPIQNIGAYGSEVKDVIESVDVFNTKTMRLETLTKDECGFRYRDSIFKKSKGAHFIVVGVTFLLDTQGEVHIEYKDVKEYFTIHPNVSLSLETVRDAIVHIRMNKLPDPFLLGTVGSFFKNPIVSKQQFEALKILYPNLPGFEIRSTATKIPLAWVLETLCRAKGLRKGNVGVYEKQPLVLVHYGGGTAQEIKDFSETLRFIVQDSIGIKPEYEISFVGEF